MMNECPGIVSLSRSAIYAIQAVHCLANCGQGLYQLEYLAICSGVPRPYLAKILVKLRNAGIVVSKRGEHGGYVLADRPEQTSLQRVVEAVSPLARPSPAWLPEPLATCLDEVDATVWRLLARTTIADLEPDAPADRPTGCCRDERGSMDPTQVRTNPTRRST